MLKNLRLQLLPNTAECLRWASDGCLAVLAGEDVVILVPNTSTNQPNKKNAQFWRPRIKMRDLIIAAIDDEIIAADREIYSIGEEQGPGYVKDVAWSPLGYSKHRRCILALVSTNLQVYIFEPFGHPSGDWRMKHNLMEQLAGYGGWPEGESRLLESYRERLRARARNIAWSVACITPWNRWGDSILAVANDCLEIVLFRATHESSETVGHIQPFGEDVVHGRLGETSTFLSSLAWSPWVEAVEGKKWVSYLTYGDHGKVWMSKVVLGGGGDGPDDAGKVTVEGEPVEIGSTESQLQGVHATAWASEIIKNRVIFAFAAMQRVTIVEIEVHTGAVTSTKSYENDFLALVTGLCFASASLTTIILQLVTSSGHCQTITYTPTSPTSTTTSRLHDANTLTLPPSTDTATDTELLASASHWFTLLSETKADFLASSDLTTCLIRPYGLAVSPLGGITAVAVSAHPDDMLEYLTGANERVNILFGTHEGTQNAWSTSQFNAGARLLPSPHTMATEALFLELTALGPSYAGIVREAVETVLANAPEPAPITNNDGDLITALDAALLKDTVCNAARYKNCLALHPHPTPPPPDNPTIILAACTAVLSAPHDPAPASMRLLYSLATVGILGLPTHKPLLHLAREAFTYLDAHTPADVSFSLEQGVIAMHLGDGETLEVERGVVSGFERCVLCGGGMVWRDVRVAECEMGHRFSRCAVTYLPVTGTGTLECAVCERTVLGEAQAEPGLAAAVEHAWECCLQCGGRYWGEDS